MSGEIGSVRGVVLAAGAGTRMGIPKALLRDADGTAWVVRAVHALQAGGCADVVVVLGARAEDALQLVPADARTIVAERWREGLSASLRVALRDASDSDAVAVLVTLVDVPEQTAGAARRVLTAATAQSLARAVFDGVPGHPVLIGRAHWPALDAELEGDRGAAEYLARHRAEAIECGDLGGGDDRDAP